VDPSAAGDRNLGRRRAASLTEGPPRGRGPDNGGGAESSTSRRREESPAQVGEGARSSKKQGRGPGSLWKKDGCAPRAPGGSNSERENRACYPSNRVMWPQFLDVLPERLLTGVGAKSGTACESVLSAMGPRRWGPRCQIRHTRAAAREHVCSTADAGRSLRMRH